MDILNQIQDLDKLTLGERYKLINKLISTATNKDLQENILVTFKPKDNLEKKLWTRLLGILKAPDLFIKTLKSEDYELIAIMLSDCKWFFETKTLSVADILNICPDISTSIRHKFLLSLCKYYNNVDDVFKSIQQEYGIKSALPILPYCSDAFTKHILYDKNIVNAKMLLKLYTSKANIVKDYLYYKLEHKECINIYENVLLKLALKEPQVFLDLYNNNDFVVSPLGANTTKKLINTNKAYILDNPERYYNILHQRQVHACFNYDEYKHYYVKLSPTRKDDYAQDFNNKGRSYDMLKYIKKNKIKFLSDAYQYKFNENILDNISMISEMLMDMLPIRLRQQCVHKVLESLKDKDKWYVYLSPDISIQKFKDYIYICNDSSDRLKYVLYMIKCCTCNNAYTSLEHVMEYINKRHKNEDAKFRTQIIKALSQCNMNEFSLSLWTLIHDLLSLINMNDEWSFMTRGPCRKLLEARLYYNIKNNININEYIIFFIKLCKSSYSSSYNILQDYEDYERSCIHKVALILPTLSDFDANNECYKMANTINTFNENHLKDKLSIIKYDWIIEEIKAIAKANKEHELQALYYNLKNDDEAIAYFKEYITLKPDINLYDLHKYIKDINFVYDNYDKIMQVGLDCYNIKRFVKFVLNRKFIYIPGLRARIIQTCLDKFKNDNIKIRANALKVLALLLHYNEFYTLVDPYIKDVDENVFALQQTIALNLCKFPGLDKTFSALNTFCHNDLLKYTISSLTSVCLKTNQRKALNFLYDKGLKVSTQKHYIRLINTIDTKRNSITLLTNTWKQYKHPSLRHIVTTLTLKWFTNDADTSLWTLLQQIFQDININDKDIFNALLSFNKVEPLYIQEHIKLCWTTAERLSLNQDINLDNEKSTILLRISKNITVCHDLFVRSILDKCFDIYSKELQQSYTTLLVAYTLQNTADLKYVHFLVKQFVDKFWLKTNDNIFVYPYRNIMFDFIDCLSIEAILTKTNNKTFDNIFHILTTIFEPTQIYTHYLKLKLTKLYLNNSNSFIKSIKQDFIDPEIQKYGHNVMSYLIEAIKMFLNMHENKQKVLLCLDLAKMLVESSQRYYIGALMLIDNNKDNDEYKYIINTIMLSTDSVVQIYLNEYLNNYNE